MPSGRVGFALPLSGATRVSDMLMGTDGNVELFVQDDASVTASTAVSDFASLTITDGSITGTSGEAVENVADIRPKTRED